MRNMKKKFQIIDNTTEALKISSNPTLSVLKTLKGTKTIFNQSSFLFWDIFYNVFFVVINV